jgi:hypothetical protein
MSTMVATQPYAEVKRIVPIAALHFGFDVRRRIDQERVDFLAELIRHNDPRVRPILVAEIPKQPDGTWLVVIDGRHRWQAYKELGYTEVPVEVSEESNIGEQVLMATVANLGGPKPPTKEDVRTSVKAMILNGKSDAWVLSRLSEHLPKKFVQESISWVRSNLQNVRIRQAVTYRNETDCSYQDAALKFAVPVETLKEYVKRKDKAEVEKKLSLSKAATHLNQVYGNKLAALLKDTADAYEKAELTYDDAIKIRDRVYAYRSRIESQCKNFELRLSQPS